MNWKKVIFGGAGPKVNASRRNVIDSVKADIEMWRDFDNDEYRIRAIETLRNAQ